MKSTSIFSLALAATLTAGLTPFAQGQATTDPVGAVSITIKGNNSDTIVAVPLTTEAQFSGSVATTASSGTVLNVTGTSWTADQFANLYYVRFTSGTKNGMYYTITANTATQLTVDAAGDDLSGIAAADTFKIYKHWTLNTLLPYNDSTKNPLTVSAGSLTSQRRSQILIPNTANVGMNPSSSATYYFTSAGWIKAATGNPASNDVVLDPETFIIFRQPSTVSSDVTLTLSGGVAMNRLTMPLATRTDGKQDNPVALARPVDVTLAQSGLDSGFVASAGYLTSQRRDELYVYDNTATGINKSASKTYYRVGTDWIRATTGNPVSNSDVIKAGDGVMIRKYQTSDGLSVSWVNNAAY